MTTSIAQTDVAEVQKLLDSPLTATETTELKACELQIELAGKDRLEKALIIGEKLSTIYNNALFRGDGGRTWADWVEQRLPELLPEAGKSIDWADDRRSFFEVRALLTRLQPGEALPASPTSALALKALIPRRYETRNQGWNPAELDRPAEGIKAVWQLSLKISQKQQRKNGPTKQDVAAAREELRPQLTEQGLIREMPKQFQQSTAERMAQAQARRQTVDVKTPEQTAEEKQQFDEIMADVRRRAPEVAAQNRATAVKEELNRPSKERQAELEDFIRKYNSKLNGAVASVHELLQCLKEISNIHGTEYLDDMRSGNVAGLLTVQDDLERIRSLGTELMQIAELANSCNPPTGIDMTTFEVDAD